MNKGKYKVRTMTGYRNINFGDQSNDVHIDDLYQGVIPCAANPNYPAGKKNQWWIVSTAGKIGGAAGIDVEIGDRVTCITDNAGGTQAAVGTSWSLGQVNIDPSTVAELRTGTANDVYVSPKTIKDQGITTAAATIIALAGGTTEQLKLTTTADQKALTIASTLQSATGLVNVTSTIADAALRMISIGTSMSTAFTTGKTLSEFYATHTSAATDVTASLVVGYDDAKISTALSKVSVTSFRSIISGTATPGAGTSNFIGLDIRPTVTLNAAGTNLYGVYMDFSGATNTASSSTAGLYINASSITNNLIYGAQVFNANAAVYLADRNASNGVLVDIDKASAASSWYGVNITKDLTNATAAGVLAVTNNALKVEQSIVSSALASGAVTAANNVAEVNFYGANAVATLDLYTGTALKVGVSATTTGAGTAVANGTGIFLDYDLTETAGTLTQQDTNVFYIDYDTTGTVSIMNNAVRNLFYINGTDAGVVDYSAGASTLRGANIDLSAINTASANLSLYGVDVTMPATSVGLSDGIRVRGGGNTAEVIAGLSGVYLTMVTTSSVGIDVLADETLISNDKRVIRGSRDLVGAIAADRNLSNYSVDFSQNVDNQTAGNFDITNGTGLMTLTSTHTVTTNGATGKADVDTFSGTTLYIHNHATTVAQADSLLTTTARAIDVLYEVTTGAASTHNLNVTDVARIDFDVAAGTVIAAGGAGNLNVFLIDGDGFVPGATFANNTTVSGLNVDFSAANLGADAQAIGFYGVNIAMPANYGANGAAAGNNAAIHCTGNGNIFDVLLGDGLRLTMAEAASIGVNILSDVVDGANGKQTIYTSRDITGALTADVASSGTVAEFRMENINTSATDFDLTTGGNVMVVALSHTSTTTNAKTHTDPVTGRGLVVDIDLVTSAAIDKVTVGAAHTAFIVDYTETQTGGLISHQGFEVASIQYNTTGNVDYTAGNYDLLYILGTNNGGVPTYAATSYVNGLKTDLSAMDVSDANLVLYGIDVVMPTVYGAAATSAVHATGNGNTLTMLTVLNEGVRVESAVNAGSISYYSAADVTDGGNDVIALSASKSINGILTAASTISNYMIDLYSANDNATVTDQNFSDTALLSGMISLTLNHTARGTAAGPAPLTVPDVLAGTVLNIDIDATTNDANTKLDMSARAIDVAYTLTETSGTLRLAATDIARITLTVPAGITSAGAYGLNMINLDGSAYVGNDANTTIRGINIDLGHSAAAAELTGVYIDAGGAGTIKRALYATDGTRVISLSNGSAHISSTAALITDMPVTAPGAGFDTAGGVYYMPHGKKGVGGMLIEEIYVDLHAAAVSAVATDGDAIGEAAGGAAYIGQITAALNGTVAAIEIICMEVPGGGSADINFYSNASNALVYDDALGGGTLLVDAAGNWTLGMIKVANNLPAADEYLYLGNGAAAGAGAYSAGKFIVRIYGS